LILKFYDQKFLNFHRLSTNISSLKYKFYI
jgi:hypothetical protein